MKKIILIISLAILFFSSCTVNKEVRTLEKEMLWLSGAWVGTGYQPDALGQNTWPIELNINLDKKTCKVKYPSLDCSGKWRLEKGNNHSATFTEIITQGNERCFDGGKLVITKIDDNHLSYSFFYPNNGQLGAFSTLVNKKFIQELNSKRL